MSCKRIFLGVVLGVLFLCSTLPAFADPGEVIGQTQVFHLTPSAVLVANDPGEIPGVQAFNYFFCLELFVGIFALWVKMFLNVFKREVF